MSNLRWMNDLTWSLLLIQPAHERTDGRRNVGLGRKPGFHLRFAIWRRLISCFARNCAPNTNTRTNTDAGPLSRWRDSSRFSEQTGWRAENFQFFGPVAGLTRLR